MKFRFELWLEKHSINGASRNLFNEGIVCYKVGAYRAAYIMSYLGYITILKERLISSEHTLPNGYTEHSWRRAISDLKNDKQWENAVSEAIFRQSDKNPFLINDDLRKQHDYWRIIRNDCAHAKSNLISSSHVESLWLYLESNLNKFVINGGQVATLEAISRHYDIRYTELGRSTEYLIELLKSSIKNEELTNFLGEVYNYFNDNFRLDYLRKDSLTYDFWFNIVNTDYQPLKESFISFIKEDINIFFEYLEVFPQLFSYFLDDSIFLRILRTEHIWREFRHNSDIAWLCVERLIDNKLIPENELPDFINDLVKTKSIPPENMLDKLKTINYFDRLKYVLFQTNQISRAYGIGNANLAARRIKFYITHLGFDKDIVEELHSTIYIARYGDFYDTMKNIFETRQDLRESYIQVIEELGLKLPPLLQIESE